MKIDKSGIRKDLIYKSNKKSQFQKLKTIKTYGESIFNGRIMLHTAEKEQIDIINNVYKFYKKTKLKAKKDKKGTYMERA